MNEIILPRALIEIMLDHLNSCLPEEACGLIGGMVADGRGRAIRLFPVENMLHSPIAYEMEPIQQIQAMIAMENAGMELTAIYHSHPTGPSRPSHTDIAQSYYPDAAYIIVSLAEPDRPAIGAFMLEDAQVRAIPVTQVS